MTKRPSAPPTPETSPLALFGAKVWKYFLSGVFLTSPIALTLYIAWSLITFIDEWVKNLLPGRSYLSQAIPYDIPGWGLVIAFLGFTIIGASLAGFAGTLFLKLGDQIMNKTPVLRSLYNALKQLTEALFNRDKTSFREVVLVEFPRKGTWAVGFVTGSMEGEIQDATPDELVNVFIPNSPIPTTGFVLFIPKTDLIHLKMSVDDGIKLVVSAGVITPKSKHKKVTH